MHYRDERTDGRFGAEGVLNVQVFGLLSTCFAKKEAPHSLYTGKSGDILVFPRKYDARRFNPTKAYCMVNVGYVICSHTEYKDMKTVLHLAGAMLLAFGSSVSAATFTIDGGVAGSIPGANARNEVLTNTFGFGNTDSLNGGFFGSTILLDDPNATVTAAFFGYEAAFKNEFLFGGRTIFSTDDYPNDGSEYAVNGLTPLDTADLPAAFSSGSILDFEFTSEDDKPIQTPVDPSVANGSNPLLGLGDANFYAWIDGNGSRTGTTIFLFYDDSGAGPDDNHDDFVVRLSVGRPGRPPSPVPLPAGGLLLIGGLGVLAAVRRRNSKA